MLTEYDGKQVSISHNPNINREAWSLTAAFWMASDWPCPEADSVCADFIQLAAASLLLICGNFAFDCKPGPTAVWSIFVLPSSAPVLVFPTEFDFCSANVTVIPGVPKTGWKLNGSLES